MDARRLLIVAAAGLTAGLLFGRPFLGLSVALLIAGVWYYRAFRGFLDYVKHGSEDNLPDAPGLVNDLIREFDLLRSHLVRRELKLSEYLHRFQHAAAALPDAVLVTGDDGTIEWANARAENYLGIRWPQDRGLRLANLVRHPTLTEFVRHGSDMTHSAAFELVSPVNEELRLELRLSTFGGSRLLLIARDITATYRTNQIRKDFIGNASHELRTPLTVISGYLESLDGEPDPRPEAWKNIIGQMRDQAGRMQRLINDLLKLSALESDPGAPEVEEICVADLLAAVRNEAIAISGDRNHALFLEADPAVWLLGSHRELYSAVSNLVLNAIQYTPDAGEIRISWHADDSGAHLAIADTGDGIAPDHIPRLTERFYRVDKGRSREKGGTGLGLAIVKHVLARHDATLTIMSRLEHGSTFACHFPAGRILRRDHLRSQLPVSA